MNEDTQKRIGTILDETARRDAIHICVAPAVAVGRLEPGWPVDAQGRLSPKTGSVGVVDPFLPYSVEDGQRFYIFLYPGTVTGLRHQWTHPAFDSTRREGT